jgi:ribosomal protein S18 acetylase RimI-like enzyme
VEVRDIRPGEEADAGRVTRLAYAEFADPGDPDWSGYLDQVGDVAGRAARGVPILVAIEGGRVLGTATLETEEASMGDDPVEPGTANLRMLGVDPEARGRGVGRALVEASLGLSRRLGKRAVTLHTTKDMKVAHHLYEAMGFVRDPARDWRVTEDFILYAFRLDL